MNQRIEWIDVAKGIGIFLVIVGHLISHDNFNLLADYIYSFHMPLFFFLSGLCLNNNRTFVSYVGRKAKSLLLPYLGFGILLTFLYIGLQPLDEILDGITKRLFNYGAMWFIPVLFVTELMFFHISKIRKRPLIYCMIILSVFIGWLLYYFQINLPLSLSACFVALFFYGLGFLGKNFADKLFDKMILLPVFLVAQFTVILLSSHSVIGMMQNVISQPFYNISAAIFGLLAFCMICKILSNINRWWIKLIVYFGKNTMTILCLHMCFIGYASEYVKPLFNTKIVYKGIEFVLVCAMCMFSVWLKQVLWIMVNRTNK